MKRRRATAFGDGVSYYLEARDRPTDWPQGNGVVRYVQLVRIHIGIFAFADLVGGMECGDGALQPLVHVGPQHQQHKNGIRLSAANVFIQFMIVPECFMKTAVIPISFYRSCGHAPRFGLTS